MDTPARAADHVPAAEHALPVLAGDVLPALSTLPGTAARLAELTEVWLARQRSAHTRTAYRRDLRAWLGWCAGRGVDPLRARPADVDAWIVEQRLIGARGGRPAAESTIARRTAAIASWYAYLLLNTADDPTPIARNPVQGAGRPRLDPDSSPTVGLGRNEAARLLEQAALDGPGTYALILLLLLTGARVGAAIAAQVDNLGHDRGHRVLDLAGKGSKRIRIPLPPVLGAAIDTMLTARGNPVDGPLFVTARAGGLLYELYVLRLIRRLARRAELPAADQLSPHSLRHTAITEVLDSTGGDLRRAQDFAGHADPRTTRRYDRARGRLDDHPAYLLAGRYTSDPRSS
ncbi:tyrosine-type recombinase/integrase [Dactylosporangium sucinum]|uniref:Tyrosine recombinase XerC n=1 Tax=Dactylosporangium sucinum TaxID=1424081 RepID=A0A917WRK1_9ACTN|nr:tyrosine-type recombinase/integrase [Dactylosporangium sucinum]GGM22938.1 tyrosine recombinase XerC [Dactylosporangium sucinum]